MTKPSNPTFARHIRKVYRQMTNLADDLADGKLDADGFGDAFFDLLIDGHRESWLLGAARSGSEIEALRDVAADAAQGIADGESQWLQNFVNDLFDGRYLDDDGLLKISSVNARSRLYAAKMRGTANQSFIDSSADREQFIWVMTGQEHCGDCPRLAALSPYFAGELFTVPGQGDTACLSNCKCILKRLSDGFTSFKNPF